MYYSTLRPSLPLVNLSGKTEIKTRSRVQATIHTPVCTRMTQNEPSTRGATERHGARPFAMEVCRRILCPLPMQALIAAILRHALHADISDPWRRCPQRESGGPKLTERMPSPSRSHDTDTLAYTRKLVDEPIWKCNCRRCLGLRCAKDHTGDFVVHRPFSIGCEIYVRP